MSGQRQLELPGVLPHHVNPTGGTDPVAVHFDFAPVLGALRTVNRVRVSSAILLAGTTNPLIALSLCGNGVQINHGAAAQLETRRRSVRAPFSTMSR